MTSAVLQSLDAYPVRKKHTAGVLHLKHASGDEYAAIVDMCFGLANDGVPFAPSRVLKKDRPMYLLQEVLRDSLWRDERSAHTERLLRHYIGRGLIYVDEYVGSNLDSSFKSIPVPAALRCVYARNVQAFGVLVELGASTAFLPGPDGTAIVDFEALLSDVDRQTNESLLPTYHRALAIREARRIQGEMQACIGVSPLLGASVPKATERHRRL